jgi:phosphoglucomutase
MIQTSMTLSHRSLCGRQEAIPYFRSGLKGVARSMPTSAAVDRRADPAAVLPCRA